MKFKRTVSGIFIAFVGISLFDIAYPDWPPIPNFLGGLSIGACGFILRDWIEDLNKNKKN